jgi:hypothetical protein
MLLNEFSAVQYPNLHVIENSVNRGFTGGNNDGLRAITAQNIIPSDNHYIFLLNPDTIVTEGAIDTLLSYAETHSDTGVIGPQLRYADGAIQSSRRRFPTLLTAMFESTWLSRVAPHDLLDRYFMRDKSDDDVCKVDWVVGAAMLVKYSAYANIGGFDEHNFFMYSEELDWCKRIKSVGWKIVYLPQARIIHYEGKSSEQVSAKRMLYFNQSKVRYFAKHHSRAAAQFLKIWLSVQFIWQMGLEAAKWLVGNKRTLRQERITAYRQVVAALFR